MTPSEKAFLLSLKNDPVLFSEKVLGVELWSKQKEILYSVRDNPNTICVSCNAGGKSFRVVPHGIQDLFLLAP